MGESPRLAAFRRWRPLAFDLAAAIHPGRWAAAGVSPAAAARLAGCPRSRFSLSARLDWILPGAAGGWSAWDGAPDETGEWALLSGEELWRAGLRLGAAGCRTEIARLIRRGEVAALIGAIGEDAYLFALRRAPLLWHGDGPGGADDSDQPLAERVVRRAGLGLGCWLAGLPAGLAERARLKLPPASDAGGALAGAWPPERRGPWLAGLKRVFALGG